MNRPSPTPGTAARHGANDRSGLDLIQAILCVPITSSTSCDQVIFVDQAADVSVSSDPVLVGVDRLG